MLEIHEPLLHQLNFLVEHNREGEGDMQKANGRQKPSCPPARDQCVPRRRWSCGLRYVSYLRPPPHQIRPLAMHRQWHRSSLFRRIELTVAISDVGIGVGVWVAWLRFVMVGETGVLPLVRRNS